MSKGKSSNRTLSKAEREMTSYLRLQNISGFIDTIDKKLEHLSDDVNLLLALIVATPKESSKMKKELRDAATKILEQGEENAVDES